MGFVRVLHHYHYDAEDGKFKSLAFKNSSDDSGISVFDADCAMERSETICGHISRFYPNHTDDPAIFWHIPNGTLPAECEFLQVNSDTGDDCHYNIAGLTKGEARQICKRVKLEDVSTCINGNYRPTVLSDLTYINLR